MSITRKFVIIGAVMLAFFAAYIYADFRFAHHMVGAARQINLAGSERMRMMSIAYLFHAAIGLKPEEEMPYTERAEDVMAEYEEILYGLRDGSEKLGFDPIPRHAPESLLMLSELTELWEGTQKPALQSIMALPAERKDEACLICHVAIRENMGKINELVS
ncbi:MAG: type IV pili methyl-accepting chemotaxis transducer N-terminal domain-containing protein, partial [Thermodesulfovibrionales bacterium]|nr:type IV pili methyl-accepting chemotaxis transducer N-terminal domain-containing protein [Thermodesulfovibrionales bacterium]